MKIILASKVVKEGKSFKITILILMLCIQMLMKIWQKNLLSEGADPLIISKNLAELKAVKVSNNFPDTLVLGADSVISLNDNLINKPNSREEALKILEI